MTLDTDILIAPEDLSAAEDALQRSGCARLGTLSVGGSTWRMAGGRALDVLALRREWLEEALAAATRDAAGHPFIALPSLVIMKLESGRLRRILRISVGCRRSPMPLSSRKRADSSRDSGRRMSKNLESMIRLGELDTRRPELQTAPLRSWFSGPRAVAISLTVIALAGAAAARRRRPSTWAPTARSGRSRFSICRP